MHKKIGQNGSLLSKRGVLNMKKLVSPLNTLRFYSSLKAERVEGIYAFFILSTLPFAQQTAILANFFMPYRSYFSRFGSDCSNKSHISAEIQPRNKEQCPRTKDQARRNKGEGARNKHPRPGTKVHGPRTKEYGHRTLATTDQGFGSPFFVVRALFSAGVRKVN